MKILYLSGFYPEIGGPFFALKTLLTKISNKGIDVSVISPLPKYYDKSRLKFVENLSFNIIYVKENLPRKIFPSFSLKLINPIKHESENCDLIHLNGVFDFYSAVVALFLNTPYVLSLRGSFMRDAYKLTRFKAFTKNIFMKLIGWRIIDKASFIHVMCQKELKEFLCFFPDLREKVRVIPNGLDLNEFQSFVSKGEFAKKYPVLRNTRYIIFLGRLHKIKGIDLLISAFDMIAKEKDLYLVIAGEDDDGDGYKKKVKKWVKDFNLKNRVIFTGMLSGDDKLSALYNAEVFVLPSYSENFGIAAVEAMACGTPVVISDKVGIHREIEQNKAGIVVKTNPGGVYEGIKTLLDNENLRKQIAGNGRKMVEKYYDINKVADKMIEMYEEV